MKMTMLELHIWSKISAIESNDALWYGAIDQVKCNPTMENIKALIYEYRHDITQGHEELLRNFLGDKIISLLMRIEYTQKDINWYAKFKDKKAPV